MKSTTKMTWILIAGLNILGFQNCAPSSVADAADGISQASTALESTKDGDTLADDKGMTPPVAAQQVVAQYQVIGLENTDPRVANTYYQKIPANVLYLYSGGRVTLSGGCQFGAYQMSFTGFNRNGLSVKMGVPKDVTYNRPGCSQLNASMTDALKYLNAATEYQVVSKTEKGAEVLRIGAPMIGYVRLQKVVAQTPDPKPVPFDAIR